MLRAAKSLLPATAIFAFRFSEVKRDLNNPPTPATIARKLVIGSDAHPRTGESKIHQVEGHPIVYALSGQSTGVNKVVGILKR